MQRKCKRFRPQPKLSRLFQTKHETFTAWNRSCEGREWLNFDLKFTLLLYFEALVRIYFSLQWISRIQFLLSGSLHGGALVSMWRWNLISSWIRLNSIQPRILHNINIFAHPNRLRVILSTIHQMLVSIRKSLTFFITFSSLCYECFCVCSTRLAVNWNHFPFGGGISMSTIDA